MSFPRYKGYKDAAVAGVGQLPEHWELTKLKRVAQIRYGIGEPPSYREEGIPLIRATNVNAGSITEKDLVLVNPSDIPEKRIVWLSPGDIIVVRSGAYTGDAAIIRSRHCPCIAGFDMVVTARSCTPDFLHYALLSSYLKRDQIDLEKLRAAQPHLNAEELGDCSLLIPPEKEQLGITSFLDHETAKIDALVEEQQRLIELLKEKRKAVISHLVTKGLNANAPIKQSAVEWLGEIPEHWDVVPLRSLFRFVKRQNGDELQVLSVYRDYGVIPKSSRDDNINKTPEDLSSYQTVQPGDLVVNKMKAWQGSLGISTYEGITSPDYAVFQPLHKGEQEYFNWLLRCGLLPEMYRSISNGIRPDQWRLEPDRFKELKVPFPPLREQREISSHLQSLIGDTDELCEQAEKAIALLQERRSALISAAVTGKIDVRELVEADAPLLDVVAA